uniref:TFD-EE n=1 Tax=synthetic construct TaxID=32630 RepID=UPI0018A7E250|nr:Chain A, TFD-EE [synthetic construct]6WXP_B Chain B, TFD-EE [synthetic construct]6WXP_C Chain C, TFD-EE [synthetic construct]6WXP_D Chain D, TFD-EE [synthetic construct]6WXP_E Chain E, TFD-EE [synthetic construct]6WXP_F Chain F, TFD-EE [synthetic construct]
GAMGDILIVNAKDVDEMLKQVEILRRLGAKQIAVESSDWRILQEALKKGGDILIVNGGGMTITFRGDDLEALLKAAIEMIKQALKFGATITLSLDGNDLNINITGVPEQVRKELAKEAERLAKEFGITVTRTGGGDVDEMLKQVEILRRLGAKQIAVESDDWRILQEALKKG